MAGRTARRRVLRVRAGNGAVSGGPHESRADLLAVEEPLEIRVAGEPLAVTMRTPGDDIDLAAGFLAGEGVVAGAADIARITLCDENVAEVMLADGVEPPTELLRRNFLTTSACGVCGKDSIDAIRVRAAYDVSADGARVEPATLAGLPGRLREAQREQGAVGAVDKVVGWALRKELLPLAGCVLLVSGRASFELTQKALLAGIPVLAAVSAPSSLAVELAEESGMTLIGFLRGDSMNAYTGAHRLAP